MENFKLSIVVPVFNKVGFTKQLFNSLFSNAQEESTEIVFVDNGSTDGTREYLDSLEWEFSNVKVVRNVRNEYVTPAWNQGFHASSGEFVIFMNNDITLFPGFDTKLIKGHRPGKVTCPMTLQHGSSGAPFAQTHNINGTCWMVKRSDWDEDLPNSLLLWYSDDFAFHKYGCTWIPEHVVHWGSQTLRCLQEADPIIAQDQRHWKEILKEKGWNDPRFA